MRGWAFDFSNACTSVTDIDPQDVSTLFQPGVNHLWLRLYDRCGTAEGNSPLYLSAPADVAQDAGSDERRPADADRAAVLPRGTTAPDATAL
jgi:hypothetical protein